VDAGTEAILDQARMLIRRLERLSADSTWARRASGCRGAILKVLDEAGALQAGEPAHRERLELDRLQYLIQKGFELLEKAAREIPDLDMRTSTRTSPK
jgi:hypothetical protein